MPTDARHYQQWEVRITPEDGEVWPRVTSRDGREIQPSMIVFYAQTGRSPVAAVRGKLIRQDGTVGKRDGSTSNLPSWAAGKLANARQDLGWTPDYFKGMGINPR